MAATIIVPYSGPLNNKDTPDVRLPINATMSTGALMLALVYAIPGFTLVAVSMKAMSFTEFHAGILILLLLGMLFIAPASRLLFKFFRFNTMLSVDRDGYIDHRRSPNKVYFDEIEAFYPIYGVHNFRLEALYVKLKGAEKDQKAVVPSRGRPLICRPCDCNILEAAWSSAAGYLKIVVACCPSLQTNALNATVDV
jgi:hypothetical protein